MNERQPNLTSAIAPASGCRSVRRRTLRRAVTLIELLLVLALLVILATAAYPAFSGPMKNQKLRQSADRVRSIWGQAQVQAMKTGRMHMFRIQKDTNMYEVRPFEQDQEAAVESSDTRRQIQVNGSDAFKVEASLPEEMRFIQVAAVKDVRTALAEQQASQDASLTADGFDEAWSSPILFYPDGTSSNARLLISNERYFVMLQLRGLTGVAQVSDLMTADEIPEAQQQ